MKLKLGFDSKVTLGFYFGAILIWLINFAFKDFTPTFFSVGSVMHWQDPWDYFRLFSYILGHANAEHLFGNLTFILLLGPIIEEKYSSWKFMCMILFTALVTSGIHIAFFSNTALTGASGIVFMLMLLGSYVSKKENVIPLTVIIVAISFLGKEVINATKPDNIAQLAHIFGGLMGALFGMMFSHRNNGFGEKKTEVPLI